MIPQTARVGDFVEISGKRHKYYGMIGCIKEINGDKLIVDVYGKAIEVGRKQAKMRARVGSVTHKELGDQVHSQATDNLDELGYDNLIDFAIMVEDWEWAQDLVKRKQEYLANREKK